MNSEIKDDIPIVHHYPPSQQKQYWGKERSRRQPMYASLEVSPTELHSTYFQISVHTIDQVYLLHPTLIASWFVQFPLLSQLIGRKEVNSFLMGNSIMVEKRWVDVMNLSAFAEARMTHFLIWSCQLLWCQISGLSVLTLGQFMDWAK